MISIKDNCGGIAEGELSALLSPGASQNSPDAEIIGVFGVGSKRAVVALGEDIEIQTRFNTQNSYSIDIDSHWLASDDWEIPYYKIPNISPKTTKIIVRSIRLDFDESDIDELKESFSYTYAKYLKRNVSLFVNDEEISPKFFDNWAYPTGNPPRRSLWNVEIDGQGEVSFDITGGLIRDRNAELENYGVYFYCNGRLISRDLKTRDVGYNISTEAGVPHPDASLCRVIIEIDGPAKLMPWNSSKTEINFNNAIVPLFRPTLKSLIHHYSSLSRRLKKEWSSKVFNKTKGKIEERKSEPGDPLIDMYLPDLPRVRKSHEEHILDQNKEYFLDKPYTRGIVEGILASDIIKKKKNIQTRSRIALILIDSSFEISRKEYIVHNTRKFPKSQYNDSYLNTLFKDRTAVIELLKKNMKFSARELSAIETIDYFYKLRCKLIHERASAEISWDDIDNFRDKTSLILEKLFGVDLN